MKQVNLKKYLLPNLPYVLIALYATKLGQAWRLAPGADASAKLLGLLDGFAAAFQSALPSFHPLDLLVGLCCGAALRLAVYIKGKNAKKYRKGAEYGSARWGTKEDIRPFMDPIFENNVILTATEFLTMNNRPKDPKTARNKNFLIIGGSGSGKTRFVLKPNLMQCDSEKYPCSFVVTDPKGSVVIECGKMLRRKGYRIKIMNTINFKKSHHYNPFAYIHSEKDILKLVNCLMVNTKGEGKSGDDFWQKAETLLYTALIGYIHYEAPVEEQNFATLLEFINAMEVREDDEEFKNPVDLMCHREGLYQIDLLNGSKNRVTDREYWAQKKGQAKLDRQNAPMIAGGITPRQTKFETNKEKLRQTIRKALATAASFDEFSSLLLREGVSVKESRGRLSYLTPDRTKPITARKLGDDFDRAAVFAVLEQNAARATEKAAAIPEYPRHGKTGIQPTKAPQTAPKLVGASSI